MIIDLASVGKDPRPLEATFLPEQIELNEGVRLTGAVSFNGEISHGSDERTRVRGHISAKGTTDCARCLDQIERSIEIDFEDIFADESAEPKDEDLEIQPGDLDESLMTGGEIDVTEVVREQLVLATDEAVLCKEDCKGLCPACGTNRNLKDCSCSEDEIDPRWAALKNLKQPR